jgi:hypothetical protein
VVRKTALNQWDAVSGCTRQLLGTCIRGDCCTPKIRVYRLWKKLIAFSERGEDRFNQPYAARNDDVRRSIERT